MVASWQSMMRSEAEGEAEGRKSDSPLTTVPCNDTNRISQMSLIHTRDNAYELYRSKERVLPCIPH